MSPATYKLLADALVIFHMTFVAFVLLGALLVPRWRWVGVLHLPALLWIIYAESTSTICPLTPLENRLRERAGISTYTGGFVDHYLMPVLYPAGLTRDIQFCLAVLLGLLAVWCYQSAIARVLWRRRRRRFDRRGSFRGFSPPASDNSRPGVRRATAGHQVPF